MKLQTVMDLRLPGLNGSCRPLEFDKDDDDDDDEDDDDDDDDDEEEEEEDARGDKWDRNAIFKCSK